MQTTAETTVREFAMENPSGIRVFESLGIDYCCGGKKSLHEACAGAGIDVNRVLELLENAERESKTQALQNGAESHSDQPLGSLISRIVETHHAYVRRETPRINGLLAKVVARHGSSHPEVAEIQRVFTAIGQELSTHMMKEEQILFPCIARLEHAALNGIPLPRAFFGSVERPIGNMVAEHEDAGALLSRIRELSGDFAAPAGACPTFRALYQGLEEFERDLHHHVHLENNILFPRAIELEKAGR